MQRLLVLAVLSIVIGSALTWTCVSLMGLLAVLVVENRYFGLPVNMVTLGELFIAWVPLGIATGIAIGKLLPGTAIRFSMAVTAVVFATLCFPTPQAGGDPWHFTEHLQLVSWVTISTGPFLLVIPASAVAARRLGPQGASI